MADTWLRFSQTRDLELRRELIESYSGLAVALAMRFRNRGESIEDLMQVAALALIGAVDRFDPTRGVEFGAFATRTVIGALKRHLRDKGWALRAPRRLQEIYLEVGKALPQLTQRLGRTPRVGDISRELDIEEELIIEAMVAGQAYRHLSLDNEDDPTLRNARAAEVEGGYEAVERDQMLTPLLEDLLESDREILRLRFSEGLSQSEIALQVGLSQMQISRRIARALELLRNNLDGA